jgi:hypothetical protein
MVCFKIVSLLAQNTMTVQRMHLTGHVRRPGLRHGRPTFYHQFNACIIKVDLPDGVGDGSSVERKIPTNGQPNPFFQSLCGFKKLGGALSKPFPVCDPEMGDAQPARVWD